MMTPFEKHGALHVSGIHLTDSHGSPLQLFGMSTHGIAWFPKFVCLETFRTLRDQWHTNCVRLAMYTAEHDGYCTDGDKESTKALVRKGVESATELGMYVIIDWHILRDENPMVYQEEAIAFFDEMSRLYANHANVIYEICNEPCGNTTWADVSAYANRVIPVIRANAPEAVIIVGTTCWSQDIHYALEKPLAFDNLMYALHFYAATHTDGLRGRMRECLEAGLPVFVSEFGTCDASGNGALDPEQTAKWRELMDEYQVSYMCWNLANEHESSSIVRYDCPKVSDWEDCDLNEQGILIRDWFSGKA